MMASSSISPYKRLLIKLSGETFMGDAEAGICSKAVLKWAQALARLKDSIESLAVVIGAGNLYRGKTHTQAFMRRPVADQIGMLATVMNGLALSEALHSLQVGNLLMSAVVCGSIVEPYSISRAKKLFDEGVLLIFAGGTGNPFFTTDSAAVLRSCEMGVDLLVKATNIDGVYSADPRKESGAVRYETISYDQVLADNLSVMDAASIALCRDNGLPLLVCDKKLLLGSDFANAMIDPLRCRELGTFISEVTPCQ